METMDKKKYSCRECGKEDESRESPDCCGKKMEPVVNTCTQPPASAEHARPMEDEEPCDDNRAGG